MGPLQPFARLFSPAGALLALAPLAAGLWLGQGLPPHPALQIGLRRPHEQLLLGGKLLWLPQQIESRQTNLRVRRS